MTLHFIFLSILFVLDLFATGNSFVKTTEKNPLFLVFIIIRISVVWSLLFVLLAINNKYKLENPCPEFEKVENVYKLKY